MNRQLTWLLRSLLPLLAGCDALLGDFRIVDATADPGDAVGEVGAGPGDGGGLDASLADSTVGPDATQDGRIRPDADAAGDSRGQDAALEAASEAGPASCSMTGNCSFGECQSGSWTCTDGGPACEAAAAVENGTPCAANGDAGAHVCSGAQCVACNAGGDCSDAATPCVKLAYDCSSGTAQCTAGRPVADGIGCGAGLYCYGSVCTACRVGASCPPAGNGCHVGAVTACTGGLATCTDQGTPATAGTSCAVAGGAAGVCDGNGSCVACSAGAQCSPQANPCQIGAQSCSGAPLCVNLSSVREGQTCAASQICHDGACVVCDVASCPGGCCDSHGCVTAAQSVSECGTGAGGGACATCPGPSAGTGAATCGGNTCGVTCSGSTPDRCGTSCVNLMTSSASCGSCGQPCSTNVVGATATCAGGRCSTTCNTASYVACGSACVNLLSDTANCGSCGHSCLGTSCSSGLCLPTTLASAQAFPDGLAIDATNVFWANSGDGTIMKCALGGCNQQPTTLALGLSTPHAVVVSGIYVFWTTEGGGAGSNGLVMSCATAGCNQMPTTVVATAGNTPLGLAADANYVYWTAYNSNFVGRCSIFGCAQVTVLAIQQNQPFGIAVDSTNVYWANEAQSERLMKCAIGGCAQLPTALASALNTPADVAVDATNVYWVGADALMKCSTAGCTRPTTLAASPAASFHMTIDSANAYWTTAGSGSDGKVLKCSINGCLPGGPTTLASGLAYPAAIAVDSSFAYWTNGGGTVMRVAK